MSGPTRINARAIGAEAARATWALSARDDLIATAQEYHAVLSYSELADSVQERTGIHTAQSMRYWIGDVLFRVAKDCAARGEPNLASLCLTAAGKAGEVYVTAMAETRGVRVDDPEGHAAHERLDCYRHFGAELPEGGGEPDLPTPQAPAPRRPTAGSASRTPATRASRTSKASTPTSVPAARAAEREPAICPGCWTALPASGICDYCDV